MKWDLAFEPYLSAGWLWFLLAVLAVSLVGSWRANRRLENRALALTLMALRGLGCLGLAFLLWGPSIEIKKAQEIPGAVAILVDRSSSMALEGKGTTRIQMVREALVKAAPFLQELSGDLALHYFSFGGDLSESSRESLIDPKLDATLPRTNILQSIEQVKARFAGKDRSLSAILLFSDGGDRENPAESFAHDVGVPIFAFQPGNETDFRDLRIAEVFHNDFAFVKTPMVIEADIILEGLKDQRVPVTLLEGNQVIATTNLEMKGDGAPVRAQFQVTPQQMGSKIYTVRVPRLTGEVLYENNERSFLLHVIRDKIRVLHVAGHPSWDEKFLRLALKGDPNIDLISFYILRTREDIAYDVQEDELALIPFPHQELFGPELPAFDLVIFQDFSYRKFFPMGYLENLKAYVEKGGAFFMMGGGDSFSASGYGETPLASVLPFRLQSTASDFEEIDYGLALTAVGGRHPITRLHPDAERNAQLWSTMPRASGLNRVGGLESGAVSLVETRGAAGGNSILLAAREVGKGRTLALATDSSWRWNFFRVRDGGTAEVYNTWVKNAIRWLIGDPTESLVDVEALRVGGAQSKEFDIVVRSRDRGYQANPHAALRLTVEAVRGKVVPLERKGATDAQGRYEIHLALTETGYYRVRAEVQAKDGGFVAGETVFEIQGGEGEWVEPRINSTVLRLLAEKSGGKLAVLPDEIRVHLTPRKEYRVLERRDVALSDRWEALLLVAGLWIAEWWLRRRAGLV